MYSASDYTATTDHPPLIGYGLAWFENISKIYYELIKNVSNIIVLLLMSQIDQILYSIN